MANPPQDQAGKKSGLFFFSFILIAVSIAGMVVSGILLYEKKFASKTQEVLPSETDTTTPPSESDQALLDVVSVALSTHQYTILIQNLAPVIAFEVTGTSCCGDISVSDVMKNLAILNEAQGPWTFEKDTSDKNTPVMIGTSSNDYLFGYSLDSQDQIKKIVISKPEPITPTPTIAPTPEVQGVATVSAAPSLKGAKSWLLKTQGQN